MCTQLYTLRIGSYAPVLNIGLYTDSHDHIIQKIIKWYAVKIATMTTSSLGFEMEDEQS